MQKKYGATIVHAGEDTPPMQVVSSGSYTLDFALGIGGFPIGYIIEIYGKESSGKTSLAYYALASEQRRLKASTDPKDKEKVVAFVNLEGRFSSEWAAKLGVDLSPERLIVTNPAHGSMAADILYDLVNSEIVSMVVFDSVGAMLGEEEMEGTDRVGGQAKLVTGMVKRIMARAYQNECTVILLNQARDKIGSQIPMIESPGGHGLKHASAIRVELRRKEGYKGMVDGQKKEIGYRAVAKVIKHKAGASPKRVAEYDFYTDAVEGHEVGIDFTQEIMDLSMRPGLDVITRGGAYYTHRSFPLDKKGEPTIYSRDAVVEFLRSNPEAVRMIRDDLMARVRGEDAE